MRTATTHSGTMGSVPSTFATGYKYAGMGYTTAFDAAIPPLAARHVHEEFDDTPCIDKGFYVLMGNNHYVMQAIQRQRAGAAEGVRRLAARRRPRATRPSSSIRAASKSGSSSKAGNVSGLDANGRALRRHAAADHSAASPRRPTN